MSVQFWPVQSEQTQYKTQHSGLKLMKFKVLHQQEREEIRQSKIYYDGLVARLDKRLIDQASDVPGIIFFLISCKNL